ncbi:MAG: sulfotransferase family protein [Rubrobacteraceae bacterium]
MVQVIGAGFGRTGTLSLKAALEELGFGPCYHMTEVFENPQHVELWERAEHGEHIRWDDLLGSYRATVDWPGCTFYEEMMGAYPDAKVLLSVRDPERWYESTRNTIYRISKLTRRSRFSSLLGIFTPKGVRRAGQMVNEMIWENTFSDNFEDRAHAIEVFERHNEAVKRRVPEDKLLVYEVKEGWEPLCEFLGAEVPDTPFPHLNDTDAFQARIRRISALAVAVPVAILGLVGLVLFYTRRRARRL